jgi:hypothetical protein
MMEILRVSRDMYGQAALQGVAWELIPWFVGASLAFIIVHVLFAAFWVPRLKKKTGSYSAAAGD